MPIPPTHDQKERKSGWALEGEKTREETTTTRQEKIIGVCEVACVIPKRKSNHIQIKSIRNKTNITEITMMEPMDITTTTSPSSEDNQDDNDEHADDDDVVVDRFEDEELDNGHGHASTSVGRKVLATRIILSQTFLQIWLFLCDLLTNNNDNDNIPEISTPNGDIIEDEEINNRRKRRRRKKSLHRFLLAQIVILLVFVFHFGSFKISKSFDLISVYPYAYLTSTWTSDPERKYDESGPPTISPKPTMMPSSTPTLTHKEIKPPIQRLPEMFKICYLNDPETPTKGQFPIDYTFNSTLEKVNMTFKYQCSGKPYHNYMKQYQFPYVLTNHQIHPNWGQRDSIIPPLSTQILRQYQHHFFTPADIPRQRHILIIGNSHTRQFVSTLLCQYNDWIVSSHELQPGAPNMTQGWQYIMEEDEPHVIQYDKFWKLSVMINHPAIYSKRWWENLHDILSAHESDSENFDIKTNIDVIIFGTPNPYQAKFYNTIMWTNARQYSEQYPDLEVDAPKNQKAYLTMKTIFDKGYRGKVIFVSQLSAIDTNIGLWINRDALKQINNDFPWLVDANMRIINTRDYLKHPMIYGHECGSDNALKVDTCETDMSIAKYRNSHRCMGDLGGQPDLVSWDVIELLWEFL